MSVWVAGDCNFLLNVKRDNQIKENWNKTVDKNDEVLIIGDYIKNNIYDDWYKSTILTINQDLNGIKTIIDYDKDRHGARKDLLEMGFDNIYKMYCFSPDPIYTTHILSDKESVLRFIDKNWGAAPRSLSGFSKPFDHNILSLSIDDWGLTPIAYTEIPKLVKNMIEFYEIVEGE